MYERPATVQTPALVIYLIDASDSMNEPCGTSPKKITLVQQALQTTLRWMVDHSHHTNGVENRYKIAILAYSTTVIPVVKDICPLTEIMTYGNLELKAGGKSDTAKGFEAVESLLQAHLSEYQRSPAPLVCHFTDAGYTTQDPRPVIRRIQEMRVDDGPVLVEHIYTADHMLRKPVHDWRQWPGIRQAKDLTDPYARYFSSLSSLLPEQYRSNANNSGYHLQKGARLFFPGEHPELIPLAFAIPAPTTYL